MKNYHKTLDIASLKNIKTDVAKILIKQHRALELNHKGIQSASLDLQTLLSALLELSRENGFIKYDPFDETILIKQLNQHPPILQYNPYREPGDRFYDKKDGKSQKGKHRDFLAWETFPENEYYLVWQAPSGVRYAILVQALPIAPAHLIICSIDRDRQTKEHYLQKMSISLLRDMHELQAVLANVGYAIGFNDWGAGATINHFHTQAVPTEYLPFIPAMRENLFDFDLTGQDGHGVKLSIIHGDMSPVNQEKYPINTILLESDQFELLFERKKLVLDVFLKNNIKYNSISWREGKNCYFEAIFPRGEEILMSGVVSAGYVEMSGMLIIPEKSLFDSLNQLQPVQQAMHKASVSSAIFDIILEKILPYFSK